MRLFALFLFFSGALAVARFQEWFPYSGRDFAEVSVGTCNASLAAYTSEYNALNSPQKAAINLGLNKGYQPVYALCRAHVSCILENVSEATKAAITTASVVLGLLPTLLAIMSPSISELVLLSVHKPLLASLISFASPGVLQARVFEYEDPAVVLDIPEEAREGRHVRLQLALGPWSQGSKSRIIGFIEYLLVLACVVNTLILATELSQRAVISWGCTRNWPIYVWVFVPLVIHWIAAKGYRLTLDPKARQRDSTIITERHITDKNTTVTNSETLKDLPAPPRSFLQRVRHWLRNESTACASHSESSISHVASLAAPSTRVTIGVVLNCVAGFLSFFHLLYGTVTFSGFLFIDTLDALGQIAMRLLLSCLVCRFVTLIEIAGLRGTFQTKSGLRSSIAN